jgi:hypothetical protein
MAALPASVNAEAGHSLLLEEKMHLAIHPAVSSVISRKPAPPDRLWYTYVNKEEERF